METNEFDSRESAAIESVSPRTPTGLADGLGAETAPSGQWPDSPQNLVPPFRTSVVRTRRYTRKRIV